MNNKGFTLIELLAVIVVLAIVLIIAIPRVLTVVEASNKEAFRVSTENLIKSVKDRIVYDMTNSVEEKTYTIENGAFVGDSIPMSGELPDNATIVVTRNGSISLVARNDKYCYIKDLTDEKGAFVDLAECGEPGEPEVTAKVYGVTFNNATIGTRTDDAVGLTYTVNTSTIDSSFDTEEIYGEITEETDSYGNVFVKIPRFYIKKTKSAGNIWTYQISKEQVDSSYYLPECFKNSTTEELLDYVLIGKYHASLNDSKLESKTGTTPRVSTNIATFRTYAMNNGAGYQLIDIHALDVLQTLFYVEFATLDSQSIMYGYANGNSTSISSGATDAVPTPSGSPVSNTTGTNAMKYRGIENLWGNVFQLIDGVNVSVDQAYVAKNPANYSSILYSGEYTSLGYLNAGGSSNYILEMGYDSNHPYANFPISAGTYENSMYKDYYHLIGSGNIVLGLGGRWSSGTQAGISSLDFWFWSGDTFNYLGSRLMKKIG